ncbi:class I SAM-dependent methyltransferase [Streptomyces sp. 8N616]|uniref:class I SAM-dependent methyltransferase n=1 Tax=Streptomyces sp. 8N616 TaxID=3457414 RepID=UPI003FD5CE4E
MTIRPDAHDFWEGAGSEKTFTHRLDPELLEKYVPPSARILDYGCGYGRLTAQLAALGYGDVCGVDPSRAMIARGLREHPGLALIHQPALPLPYEDGSFDAALLFAVLNCVPDDTAQRAIAGELARLVRPGGVVYLSDVPLQSDARNVRRYEEGARVHHTYGIFTTPDGGLFRHHRPRHLHALLHGHGFTVEEERTGTALTLHGHTSERLQIVARREPASAPGGKRGHVTGSA